MYQESEALFPEEGMAVIVVYFESFGLGFLDTADHLRHLQPFQGWGTTVAPLGL